MTPHKASKTKMPKIVGNPMLKNSINFFILCVLWLAVPSHAATLDASVDRSKISLNETLTLTVTLDGKQSQVSPDFSGLQTHFDVLSNQQSSQHSVINGSVSVSTQWTLLLAPKDAGQVLIPPFQVEGLSSRPINIQVASAAQNTQPGQAPVFLETRVDKNSVWINAPFMVTFALHFNQTVEGLDKPELDIPNARLQELKRVDYQKTVGGQRYGVAEFRYLVFPEVASPIHIDAQRWTVHTTDMPNAGRFTFGRGNVKRYRPQTEAIDVEVKAKPDTFPANSTWLPASDITIEEKWNSDVNAIPLGEPVTWTLTIKGLGVTSEQLPPLLEGLSPDGFKIYPDQPSHETTLEADTVSSVRIESVAIVASQTGTITLPAVELTWWDTDDDTLKVASLPERTIVVKGTAPSQQKPSPGVTEVTGDVPLTTATTNTTTPWWLFGLLGLSLLGNGLLAFLWLNAPKQSTDTATVTDPPQVRKAYQTLMRAINLRDAKACRDALPRWWQLRQNLSTLPSLQQIALACPEENDRTAILALNDALYAPTPREWDNQAIKQSVTVLAKFSKVKTSSPHSLQPLYPSDAKA